MGLEGEKKGAGTPVPIFWFFGDLLVSDITRLFEIIPPRRNLRRLPLVCREVIQDGLPAL